MTIRKKTATGESRELLLKEYFLNAYLIALLKQAGAGVRRRRAARPAGAATAGAS